MDLVFLLIVIVLAGIVLSYLFNRLRGKEAHIIYLVRSEKPLPLFDRLAALGKPLDWFATLGFVLGFGTLAVDYLWGRKLRGIKRAFLLIASALCLAFLFLLVDWVFGGFVSQSPFVRGYFVFMAIIFGFTGFAGVMLALLALQAVDIMGHFFQGEKACPGVAPVIPGVKIPNVPFVVPLHAWISFVIILVIHEGMHGTVARREGMRIKSAGVALLGIVPVGAFVEPDERDFARAAPESALRMLSAGPAANLVAAFFFQLSLILVAAVIAGFFAPWLMGVASASIKGVEVASVDRNVEFCGALYPSSAYGELDKNWLILSVNDVNVSNSAQLRYEVSKARFKPVTLLLDSGGGSLVRKTLVPNELGSFGFSVRDIKNEDYVVPEGYRLFYLALYLFFDFVIWLSLLSFLVALVNYLPMPPFDGGKIVVILLLPYLAFLKWPRENKECFIFRFFLGSVLLLLLVNALPLFI